MKYEGSFKTREGAELYECRWDNTAALKANLVLIHGFGEYCGRYEETAGVFNAGGICVHSYDQRGFGRSPGRRAYINRFDTLLEDLDDYLVHIQPKLDGTPWFMMGHSMGGLVLARYAQTRTVKANGLIFSSPFLAFSEDLPKFLLTISGFLGKYLPWMPVGNVDTSRLSRDPAVVAAADVDPLSFHGRVCARTGSQFHEAILQLDAAYDRITLPVYAVHGSDDKVVSNTGSQTLYKHCASKDKFFKLYEGGYHELWNDLDKEAVLTGMRDWMLSHA